MGSRIIENQYERKVTAALTPLIPCSAKLPIIVLFTDFFFKENSAIAFLSLYVLSIFIIILCALIIKKFYSRNVPSTYILELPEYKVPNIKYVLIDTGEKIISFIKKAGTIILISSILVWFLLSFSIKLDYGVSLEESILAQVGKMISPIFIPMIGIDSWQVAVSAIQGLIAKEQVISSMVIIKGLSANNMNAVSVFEGGGPFDFFTVPSAYAFIVFNLFCAPCIAAIGAMKKEIGIKNTLKITGGQTILAWVLGTVIYQTGTQIENGFVSVGDLCVIFLILVLLLKLIKSSKKPYKNNVCNYCGVCKEKNKTKGIAK